MRVGTGTRGGGRRCRGRGWRASLAVLALSAIVGLAFAGCGGDDEAAAPAEPAPAEPAPAEPAPAEPAPAATDTGEAPLPTPPPESEAGVTDYVAYTGGTAGSADSSLAPIKIGWSNVQGGSINPIGLTSTDAAQFAVDYVNSQLGGVGGHPIELATCFIANTEEEGLACGQQFLNDPDISVIAYGAVSVGANTINSTINGQKPIVAAFSVNPSDVTNPNTYLLFGAGKFSLYGWGTFGKEVLGATSNAVLYPEGPGFQEVAEGVKQSSEAAGLTTKVVGFDPNSSDLVGALTAAGAQTADMISPMVAGDDCVSIAKGMVQLGIEPGIAVSLPQCTDPSLKEAYGGDFPLWKYGIAQSGDALENPPREAGVAFNEALATQGAEGKGTDPWYPATFSQILTIVQWMNAIGADNITPETIAEKAQAFAGPLLMGGPIIQCGKYPDAPAVCADGDYFFQYEGDGAFTRISGWMQAPPELQAELGAVPSGS